jgi:hypothetical protein
VTNAFISDIETVAKKIEAGFVFVFHAIEHEVPAILSLLVNLYGPSVIANAIATHQAGVANYVDSEIGVAAADTQALVQSTLVEKFGLAPTAGQFVASGIAHLFAIGEAKVNSLINAGATALENQVNPPPPPTTT